MKKLLILSIALSIIWSCTPGKKLGKNNIDRTSPEATAIAILDAYKSKDIVQLKELSNQENTKVLEQLILDSTLIETRGVFDGWRWAYVNQWDGTIKDVRIELESRRIYAVFYEPPNVTPQSELGVVAMDLEGGVWCFVDILSPDKQSYETLYKVESMNN